MFTLSEAASALAVERAGPDVAVARVQTDSRTVSPGGLFVALRGERHDGHDHVDAAFHAGAAAALVAASAAARWPGKPLLVAPDTKRALGLLAAWWRRRHAPALIAVAGSNGKTTTKEMHAGDNDLAPPSSRSSDVESGYRELAQVIHRELPATDVFVLSIKPSLARFERWPEMREANRRLEAWAASDPRLHYLDVATPLLGTDGKPRPECLVSDGLHPSPQGYAEWTRVIREPLLRQAETAR